MEDFKDDLYLDDDDDDDIDIDVDGDLMKDLKKTGSSARKISNDMLDDAFDGKSPSRKSKGGSGSPKSM